jgi:hypothetical protein
MPFEGVVHPEQLDMLTKALKAYCQSADIKPDTTEYELAGLRLINLFESGVQTADELLAALHGTKRDTP